MLYIEDKFYIKIITVYFIGLYVHKSDENNGRYVYVSPIHHGCELKAHCMFILRTLGMHNSHYSYVSVWIYASKAIT